ncbi:MAG: ClpXP protease specificity-enhancing factor [Burkholderiaceae bacterium]|nr:ClpXP protease specificity-enhancing factor [Burkholderiaceae bacterium]
MSETSTKPYLIRAIYEWCTDNGYRPYIAVVVDGTTEVPLDFVRNGGIVLNVSADATSHLAIGNETIEFEARFNRIARRVSIPIANVSAVYAAENGHGMAFEVHRAADDGDGDGDGGTPRDTQAIEVQSADEARHDDADRGLPGGAGAAGGSQVAGGLRVVASTRPAEARGARTRKESGAKPDRTDAGAGAAPPPARPALLEAVPSPGAAPPAASHKGADSGASAGRSDDDPGGKPPGKPPSGRKPRLTRVK